MRQPSQVLLGFLLLLLSACGEDPASPGTGTAAAGGKAVQAATERFESEQIAALRRALDLGLHGEAVALLEILDPAPLGIEFPLLQARLASLEGRDVDVTPFIEKARLLDPSDPRVYATAAELHAASGRLETATEELARGLEAAGICPELLRAQGVVELCRQGRAQAGVDLFNRALKYDPSLPFTLRPRAQGYLLLAKLALSEQRLRAALVQVQTSLSLDPLDEDARLFFADALAGNGDYPSAVKVLEQLILEGVDRRGELALMYKRAALGEMLLGQREGSLEYFRLARESGLNDEELGTGVDQLAAAARSAIEAGVSAFQGGELETARIHFEQAVAYDGGQLLARTQLAVVLFQQGKYLPAATHYREVLDQAIARDLQLPDPVHIFLAKALHAAGDKLAAKEVLKNYLEREPEGQWVSETGSLLGEL